LTTRRFLSLWLPRLATDRARRLEAVDPAAPLAAIARVRNAERLVCVDANAARLGLTAGLSLADARARHPTLVVVEASPAEEAQLLERLCDWCSRFTPLAALDGCDGLMLDISGVAHLFGGEPMLVDSCIGRLAAFGIAAAGGVAGNPRAAWALARFAPAGTVGDRAGRARRARLQIAPEDPGDKAFVKLLHDLPLAALGLDSVAVADLARAGLKRVGDIAFRPRAPITARFGPLPMARLDELRGLARPSIAPRFAAPDFCAERRFASPVQTVEAIEATLRKLADDLVVLLERRAKGARRIELALYRVDGDVRRIRVGASRPLNEARAIVRLFAEKLASPQEDAIDAGFGVDLVRLSCLAAEPLAPSQSELERAHEAERARALADLVDRLSARLGSGAVTRRALVEAHLPDEAEKAAPATLGPQPAPASPGSQPGGREGASLLPPAGGEPGRRPPDQIRGRPDEGQSSAPARPLRLFGRPEPIDALAEAPDGPPLRFRWRRVLHDVAAIEGPERIAPPWWRREGAPTRDYFRAEDTHGRRFWLYREGLWGEETGRAKWFVHGLFG
jgi:protein ImuB